MKVKFTSGIGYSGANREVEVELPDDWTEVQILEELLLWSDDYIDIDFDVLDQEITVNVIVDFEYGKPVIMTSYKDGNQFMKSKLVVKIPARHHYVKGAKYSCTELQYNKWQDKTFNKIEKAILDSFKEGLYGTINIAIRGLYND